MTSILDDVADALLARWTTAAIAVDPDVVVRRGAPVGGGFGPGLFVVVEFDGRPDASEDSRFERTWIDLACTRQREDGEVTCTVIAQSGDSGDEALADAERATLALLDACDADLRADMTVGGVAWSARITRGAAAQMKNEGGVAVLVPFTVAYSGAV